MPTIGYSINDVKRLIAEKENVNETQISCSVVLMPALENEFSEGEDDCRAFQVIK